MDGETRSVWRIGQGRTLGVGQPGQVSGTRISLLLGLPIALLVAWWYWPAACARGEVLERYLDLIAAVEFAHDTTGRVPDDGAARGWCIEYAAEPYVGANGVPDDRAIIWLKLPSRRHLGYVVPVGRYTAADATFDGMAMTDLLLELRAIDHGAFQRHLAAHLDERDSGPGARTAP